MAEEQLRKALALMKQGDRKQALQIAQAVIKQDRNNINAWWLTANLFSDQPERQKKALEKVLAINPLHKGALKMMEVLESGEKVGYQPKAERQKAKPSEQVVTTQEIEFDWSRLEAKDAANKKKGDAIPEHHATRIANFAILGFALVIVAVIVMFVVVPTIQDIITPPPDKVVINFYKTFFVGDFDTARELVCADQLTKYERAVGLFSSVMEDTQWEFSDLAAEIKEQTADTASVKVSGSVTIKTNGESETLSLAKLAEQSNDDTLESLRYENDKWCIAEVS
jgi:tetratricopeptide (TPR) repeat protein